MPSFNKYFRLTDNGIEISSENASQSLRPDSQSLFSVIAPMPWICMNVFWSMTKSISGFCQNLNRQFIYDKSPDNGNPGESFVQINGGLRYYKLSLWDVLFITAPATTKVFENILILLLKLGISVLLEAGIYLENRNESLFDFRFCNDCLLLFIMIDRRGGGRC
jgi:hypothetical protein